MTRFGLKPLDTPDAQWGGVAERATKAGAKSRHPRASGRTLSSRTADPAIVTTIIRAATVGVTGALVVAGLNGIIGSGADPVAYGELLAAGYLLGVTDRTRRRRRR